MIGVIQYCNSSFTWTDTSTTEYTHLLSVLIASIPRKPFAWGEAELTACQSLCDAICNLSRACMRPSDLIGPDRCFIAMTDASDTAVAVSLFMVLRSDAVIVTEADLKDPTISRLVGIKYKKLSAAQLKWNTFEAELYGLVRVVTIYGALITEATAPYPPGKGHPSKI